MFTTLQVLQILDQVVDAVRDESLCMQMLSESWDGVHHSPEEVLQKFMDENGFVILRSEAVTRSALEKKPAERS